VSAFCFAAAGSESPYVCLHVSVHKIRAQLERLNRRVFRPVFMALEYYSLNVIFFRGVDKRPHPPMFHYGSTEYLNDGVYIGRPGELPSPSGDVACLIIFVGGGLPTGWKPGRSCVFIIMDETDILRIFNVLQEPYERYIQWSAKLREILEGSASIAEMILVTAPIITNPISLCNNNLEVETVSDPYDNIDLASIGPLSEKYIRQFHNRHIQNTTMREPFKYEIEGITAYCINIYKQETYLGLVAMGNTNHQFRPGDFELFNYSFTFVSAAKKLAHVKRQTHVRECR